MGNKIKKTFSQSENELFRYLAAVLSGGAAKVPHRLFSNKCWEEILRLAQVHA